MKDIVVPMLIKVLWEEVEPSGEKCIYCGDSIYLKEWKLIALWDETVMGTMLDHVCDSCKDEPEFNKEIYET